MTSRTYRRLSCLAFLVAASFALAAALESRQTQVSPRHVVLISLDGFPSWALDDPYLPVPTLRRLAARGAVARGMRPVNPTVTWPNHTTLITGVTPAKHGVLFNGLLKRDPGVPPRVEPWLPRDEMVRVKTLYDVAHARGMTTAQVDWVAIHGGADRDLGVSRAPGARRRGSRRSSSRPAFSRRPSSKRSPRATSSGAITSGPRRRRTSSASTSRT